MSATPGQEPTQEEIEAYYAQIRQAPVGDLLLQAFSMLGTGAEAKIGLSEARVLIDAMEALIKLSRGTLGELETQLSEAVVQLKMAQVQAEKQLAAQGGGEPGQDAAGPAAGGPAAGTQDSDAAQGQGSPSAQPAPGSTSTPPGGGQPGAGEGRQTDKLWIPGR